MQAASAANKFNLTVPGDITCKFELDLNHLDNSKAWVQRANHTEREAKLHFNLISHRLPHLLAQSPKPFIAKVRRMADRSYHVYLKEAPSESSEPPAAPPAPISSLTLSNSKELAAACRQNPNHPLFPVWVRKLIEHFISLPIPSKDNLREVLSVTANMKPEDRKRTVECLLEHVNRRIMEDPQLMVTLTKFFQEFQRLRLRTFKDPKELNSPLPPFIPDDLIKIAAKIVERLETIHRQPADEPLIAHYLGALIEIMDAMVTLKVEKVDREKRHDPFYQKLDVFTKHKLLPVAFLAEYGKQALVLVPDNESPAGAVWRHSFHFLTGLGGLGGIAANIAAAAIAGDATKLNPTVIINGAVTAYKEFKEAFRFHDRQKDWFKHLSALRFLCLEGKTEYLADFYDYINSSKLELKHPFLMFGITRLLEELLTERIVDRHTIRVATSLLYDIWKDNHEGASAGRFTIGSMYSTQLGQYIQSLFQTLLQSANPDIAHSARALGGPIMQPTPPSDPAKKQAPPLPLELLPSSSLNTFPTECFRAALQSDNTWRNGFRTVLQKLAEDEQVKEEEAYFIPPEGQETVEDPKPLEPMILDFIKSATPDSPLQTLLINAPRGSGKTLVGKLISLKLMENFDTYKMLMLHIPLGKTSKPLNKLFPEALKRHGLEVKDLTDCAQPIVVVLICDAVDEMTIPKIDNKFHIPNLILTNSLEQYRFIKRIIFTCRPEILSQARSPDYHDPFSPTPGSPDTVKELKIVPFNPRKIKDYFRNFIEVRRHKPDPHLMVHWTDPDLYLHAIKTVDALANIGARPLYLRVIGEALPPIVRALAAEKGITEKEAIKQISIGVFKLMDTFFSIIYERERRKLERAHQAHVPLTEDFFDFSIRIVRKMQEFADQVNQGNKITKIDLSNPRMVSFFAEFFDDVAHPTYPALRRGCLELENGKWGFSNDEFYEYFSSVIDLNKVDEVKRFIRTDPYKIKQFKFVNS